MTGDASYEPTERTRIRRKPQRGSYDRDLIHGILDEALICHVAFVDDGRPYAIPMIHARVGEVIYLHGSRGSRTLKTLAGGTALCLTATLVDGLVLTRAAIHHSLNYRSVVVLGTATRVEHAEEKHSALRAVVEHIAEGRSGEVRGPDEKELRGTEVLRLEIEEVSAKVREGPGQDEERDMALPHWAGVMPLELRAGAPVPDVSFPDDTPAPVHLRQWTR